MLEMFGQRKPTNNILQTSIVQWTERWTSKPSVAGSIPARGTS